MNIILSTYAYYPLQAGGTEAYTIELCNYLKNAGNRVCVLASSNYNELIKTGICPTILEINDLISIFCYKYETTDVVGVELKNATIFEQYAKYNSLWVECFQKALKKIGWDNVDALYLQGVSGISGPALLEALQKVNKKIRVACWVHTPFMCIKGNLLIKSLKECDKIPSSKNCGTCLLSEHIRIVAGVGQFLYNCLDSIQGVLPKKGLPLNLPVLMKQHFNCMETLIKQVQFWICFSSQMGDILIKMGVDKSKIIINSHGIDTNSFNSNDRIEKNEVEPYLFLFNGRWDKVKGYQTLIKAWMNLADQPNLRKLILLTKVNEKDKLKWNSFFKRGDVEIHNPITKDKLATLYRSIHCLIIPSEWVETGPLVYHEAIACGCAVIASNIGGNKYIYKIYCSNSVLFNVGNHLDLAHKIESKFDKNRIELPVKDIKSHFDELFLVN